MFCRSDHYSALDTMEIRLGKAQLIKAVDDGGVSMYFRRDPASSQQSRRVILSVEVNSPHNHPNKSRQNGKSI